MTRCRIMLVAILVVSIFGACQAEAKSIGPFGKGRLAKPLGKGGSTYQPKGRLHTFKEETRLERWTNSPKTDTSRGLRKDSFWTRPQPGPKGNTEHIKKRLKIDHPIKRREETVATPGAKYHERPTRGSKGQQREVIIHDRVSKDALKLRERIAR